MLSFNAESYPEVTYPVSVSERVSRVASHIHDSLARGVDTVIGKLIDADSVSVPVFCDAFPEAPLADSEVPAADKVAQASYADSCGL